jgi:hypothetical protein
MFSGCVLLLAVPREASPEAVNSWKKLWVDELSRYSAAASHTFDPIVHQNDALVDLHTPLPERPRGVGLFVARAIAKAGQGWASVHETATSSSLSNVVLDDSSPQRYVLPLPLPLPHHHHHRHHQPEKRLLFVSAFGA